MEKKYWKVGELARKTGLTVRTLHHYDEIGLLSPSRNTDTGHRLYTETDIATLQQIISLKQFGFSLDEIKDLIKNPEFKPDEVIRIQMERLKAHIRIQEELYCRLENIYEQLIARKDVSAEQFIKLIEVMNMNLNSHFTPEQIETLKKQSELLGPEKVREIQEEWSELIEKVRTERDKGTSPDSPVVKKLAKRWKELTRSYFKITFI